MMLSTLTPALGLLLCLVPPCALAGMEKESNSTQAGLFFAWITPENEADPVIVNFHNA